VRRVFTGAGLADRPQFHWREINPPGRGIPRLNLRELWDYRDLALILALRDIQLIYRQTLLGVAWVVLKPLIATLIFTGTGARCFS
jgi:hypothetical protein